MPDLAQIQRFFQPGITIVRDVPTIVNINSPTRAELTAGTTVTRHIRTQEGFSVSGTEIETPDMASTFPSKIPGMDEVPQSSFWCYLARDGIDIRSVWAKGDVTFIVLQYGGDVAANPMDVFKVRVLAVPKQPSTDAAFGAMIQFSITDPPAIDVPTPALT